jgi:hypothetical protein
MKFLAPSVIPKILGCLLISVVLNSCEKCDESVENLSAPSFQAPTTSEFESLQTNSFSQLLSSVSINVDGNGLNFTTPMGAAFSIPNACLSLNGTQVQGDVEFQYAELYERGGMLATNSTTVGTRMNGSKELLISGGMFFFNVRQNGEQVDLICDGNLSVPTELTGGSDAAMRPFDGEVNAEGDLDWFETSAELFISQEPMGDAYVTFFSEFGWFNCDRFYNAPDPKTEIMVSIPQEFNDTNSNIYLALQGEPNSLAYLFGEFPVGLSVHIIFVTESEGNFRYAIQSLQLEPNHQVIFTLQETQVGTLEEVIDAINSLP